MTSRERIVIDARFLGFTGMGRVTEMLLDGLGEIDPPGEWVVWGPARARDHLWPSVEFVESVTSPMKWGGQREFFNVPRGRYVALHTVRPFVARRRTALVMHDTIPVRWGLPEWLRPAKHAYWALSAHLASTIMVYSDATAHNIQRDLRVRPERLGRFDLAIEPRLVSMIRDRRAPRPDRLLYVGLNEQHKNLDRAIQAFRLSSFAASGATFVLVGSPEDTIGDLRRMASRPGPGAVVVLPRCSDAELADLYAEATLTIQPSLEEGLGLTVIEALSSGVPTCCTAGGALAEGACGAAVTFDGTDVRSIADAIDRTVQMIANDEWPARFEQFDRDSVRPTKREMAQRFLELLGLQSAAVCDGPRSALLRLE
jgi:glycosyltransferase involved in cell wall biosynthesis